MSRPTVTTTVIDGCIVIQPNLYQDVRGFFCESYNAVDFRDAGLPTSWPQDNQSMSHQNVLRGMHIQRKNPQGKLVRCVSGQIYDVCLDLRPESKTYLKWHGEFLQGAKSMYCPPGTAHGFLAMEPHCVVYYKCTSLYDAETDGGFNAVGIGITWPTLSCPVRSEKDIALPLLEEWLADKRGVWNE